MKTNTPIKNCLALKKELEAQLIAAVLGRRAVFPLDLLVPANFQFGKELIVQGVKTPANRLVWVHILKQFPEQPMDRLSVCYSLLKDVDGVYLVNQITGPESYDETRPMFKRHCLMLIELDLRLKLYYTMDKSRLSAMAAGHGMDATNLKEMRDFVADLNVDFFEMVDDLKAFLMSTDFAADYARPILELAEALPKKADKIKTSSAYNFCVTTLLSYASEPLPRARSTVIKKLADLLNKALNDADFPAHLTNSILSLTEHGATKGTEQTDLHHMEKREKEKPSDYPF